MNKQTLLNASLALIIFILPGGCQSPADNKLSEDNYSHIQELVNQKDFFSARDLYYETKGDLSKFHKALAEVFINNAFNKLVESNKNLDYLIQKYPKQMPDTLLLELYRVRHENSSKLFDYKDAMVSLEKITGQFSHLLDSAEFSNFRNSHKIWSALQNTPPQEVIIYDDVKIKIINDVAGLDNLPVTINGETENFIFDTGANISTTIRSVAERYNMKMFPDTIEVGTITGHKVAAQIGVCPLMKIGNIEVRNAVFLVLEDHDLAFPQIGYQIYGIIGFPVMEAMNEIQITSNGWFIVPEDETSYNKKSNLALSHLQPIIQLNGKHYNFDTGATSTMLFKRYYDTYKDSIENNYSKTPLHIGGGGGMREFQGYKIDFHVTVHDQEIMIPQVSVLVDDIRDSWINVYGNIGQDLIRQYDKMTINFSSMFIRFD